MGNNVAEDKYKGFVDLPTQYTSVAVSPAEAQALFSSMTGGKLDIASITEKDGQVYVDDLYDAIQNAGSKASGEEAGVLAGETASSSQSLSDMIASLLGTNPKLAAQNWELSSLYAPKYAELFRSLMGLERTDNIADVLRLAPEMQKIRRATDTPGVGNLRDMLMSQITDELSMGGKLTAGQNAQLNEQFRSAELARGFGNGSGSVNREAVQKALEGMNLLEKRQGKASALISQEQAAMPDPVTAVLGSSGQTTMAAANAATAPTMNLLSFLGQNYWNTQNQNVQQQQLAAEQKKYELQLQIARDQASPYLSGRY